MSQTPVEQRFQDDEADDNSKALIAESIRYRKRAQNAEQKVQDLAEQLTEANQRITQLSGDVEGLQLDRKLSGKLTAAGVTDLEAAMLIAKARLENNAETDVEKCIEQLRTEKGYLFTAKNQVVTPRPTAGVKDRVTPGKTMLQQAATKAAKTGNRTDLQEYLKLRRGLA